MITLNNINKKYENNRGITDFSYKFERGNVYGLIGPNGAGKTTLIKMITNFINRDSGEIIKDFERNTRLNNISYMPEFNFLIRGSVKKNIEFFNLTYDDIDLELLNNTINIFDIELNEKVSKLSSGKSKALRFAMCISRRVEVYILDEPFSGVDVITRKRMVEMIIKEINIEESLVLIASHELHDMEQLLDFVIVIDKSNLLVSKNVEDIKSENNLSLYDWFISKFN